jgi:hypothetical protein
MMVDAPDALEKHRQGKVMILVFVFMQSRMLLPSPRDMGLRLTERSFTRLCDHVLVAQKR